MTQKKRRKKEKKEAAMVDRPCAATTTVEAIESYVLAVAILGNKIITYD